MGTEIRAHLPGIGVMLCLGHSMVGDPNVACAQQSSSQNLTFQGIVQSSQNGSALPNATLQIKTLFTTGESISDRTTFTRSGPDGRFSFYCISTGAYVVEASAPGFVTERITLTITGISDDVVSLRLTAECIIGGLIVDNNGARLPNRRVNAWVRVLRHGELTFELAGNALSSASGNFEIHSLRPGDYILQVSANSDERQRCIFCDFYPRSTLSAADVIHIDPLTRNYFTITSSHQNSYSIRGHVVDLAGAQTSDVSVRLVPCSDGNCIQSMSITKAVNRAGRFVFQGIPIGRYQLQLINQHKSPNYIVAAESIYLDSSDLDDQVLTLMPHCSVTGHIAVNGDGPENKLPESSTVMLQSADSQVFEQSSNVGPDGSFTFRDLPLGSYFVRAGTSAGTYVDKVYFNGRQAALNKIDIAGGDNRLDIDLGQNAGAIVVVIKTEDDGTYSHSIKVHPTALGVVYSLTNGIPDVSSLSLTPAMDGIISIPNLRPGAYLFFALEQCDTDLWKYEEFVKSVSSRGTEIVVSERSQSVVHLEMLSKADIGQFAAELGIVLP